MHSHIIQMSLRPFSIGSDRLVSNDNVVSGNNVSIDYCYNVSSEEAIDVLNNLVNNLFPKGMFSMNLPGMTLTYNGGLQSFLKSWCKAIRSAAEEIHPDNVLMWLGPSYQLSKILDNPLNIDTLFITEAWNHSGVANRSAELFSLIKDLEKGATIYIGTILGYHI